MEVTDEMQAVQERNAMHVLQ